MTPTGFPDPSGIARQTVSMLHEIGAIRVNIDRPFTLASGIASPVYIDCRKIMSYPRVRATITALGIAKVLREVGFEQIEIIVGAETAGIPFASWFAAELQLPMCYVRKRSKGLSTGSQIEGDYKPGQRFLLIEDVTTDGASKVRFCRTLRREGARIDHVFMVFQYDIFPQTREMLREAGIKLISLATWRDVFALYREERILDPGVLHEVGSFLENPTGWSRDHGGASRLNISKETRDVS